MPIRTRIGVDRPLRANRAKAEFCPHGGQRGHDRGAVGAHCQHGQARCQQHDRSGGVLVPGRSQRSVVIEAAHASCIDTTCWDTRRLTTIGFAEAYRRPDRADCNVNRGKSHEQGDRRASAHYAPEEDSRLGSLPTKTKRLQPSSSWRGLSRPSAASALHDVARTRPSPAMTMRTNAGSFIRGGAQAGASSATTGRHSLAWLFNQSQLPRARCKCYGNSMAADHRYGSAASREPT